MFDFYGKRKIFFSISVVLVVATFLFAAIFGVQLDIQFKGGSLMTYTYEDNVDFNVVEKEISTLMGKINVNVQHGESAANGVKTFTVSLAQKEGLSPDDQIKVNEKLVELFPNSKIEVLSVNNVDATIGGEFLKKSIIAVIVAAIIMIIYIGIRFRKIGGWSAGVMAVLALFHDVFMVFAIFVFFKIPLNDNFIAVILTILGYSLNDTIVIYDRIRENERSMSRKLPLAEIVNTSINQSLGRAFGTTFATALAMITVAVVAGLYGISSIITFAIPMIAGIVSGLYSSVCITGPLWVVWENKFPSKNNATREKR